MSELLNFSSFEIQDYNFGGSEGELYLYANRTFTDDFGETHLQSDIYSGQPYQRCPFTVSGFTALVASFLTPVTPNGVRVSCTIADNLGRERDLLFENAQFLDTPNPVTKLEFDAQNAVRTVNLDDTKFYNRGWIDRLFDQFQGSVLPASTVVLGSVVTDVDPVNPALPEVIGRNSRRVTEMYNAQATAIGAIGDGVANDRAALNTLANTTLQITGAGGDIYFPAGTYLIGSNMTFPANVRLVFDPRATLKIATGQTVMIAGTIDAAPYQIFTNATAGLGTISFSGNKVIREALVEWWGGNPSATATATTAAFVAANAALVTIASGDIVMGGGGTYLTNGAGFLLGSNTIGTFTGIGLRGTNGMVGSRISYSGTGDAITVTNGRLNRLSDFTLIQSGSKGTSRGIVVTGTGGSGAYTFFSELDRLEVTGFHIGVENGNVINGLDADLVTYRHVSFEANDIGLKATGANSTTINMYDCSFESNTSYGIFNNLQAGGNFNIHGGAFGRNGKGIYTTAAGTWDIIGVRDEWLTTDANYQFFLGEVDALTVHISGYVLAGSGTLTYPLISTNAKANVLIENSNFAQPSTHAIPFGPSTASSQVGGNSSFAINNNKVNENASLFSINSNGAGSTYRASGNTKFDDAGSSTGLWDDEEGTVATGGVRSGKIKLNALATTGLQAAITRLASGTIEIPDGSRTLAAFTIDKPLQLLFGTGTYTMAAGASITVSKNLIVRGQGGNKTMLVGASGQKLFNVSGVLDGGAGTGAFFSVSDLTLDGASRSATNAIYVPNYSIGVSSFVSGRLFIENTVIQNFGSYAVDLGNSVFFSTIRSSIFTGNEGGVKTGHDADITYDDVSFGSPRSLPHITTNGSSTRVLDSSFVYGSGTGTTTPDILITTDGTDAGYVHIAGNKFGPESEVNTRYKIRIYSAGSPSVVIPNITIDRDNQFSGVSGQTAISIENPVEHLLVDQNYFNTFSTLINDAQLLANSSTGQNVFTASNRVAPAPTGTTIFANNGRGFTVRQTPYNWLDERFIKSEHLTGLINRVPNSGALNSWTQNGVTITTGQTDPLGGTTAFLLTRANASSQESIASAVLDFTSIATAQPGPTTGKQIVVDLSALAGSLSYMTVTLYDFTASLPVVTKKVMLKSVWDTYRVPFTGLDQSHQYLIYLYPGNNAATQAGTVKVWRANASDYGSSYIATDGSGNAATNVAGSRFDSAVIFGKFLIQTEGAALTVSSNTIAPTNSIHQVGAGLIKTITVPSGFTSGTIYLIAGATPFTCDATANIAKAVTGLAAGQMVAFTYSSSDSKWHPSV